VKTTTVEYLRPHSIDEMATLQLAVQRVFADTPSFVAMAILQLELKRRLDDSEDGHPDTPPEPIAQLLEALDRAIPSYVQISVKGITREESVS
jgi:hypothetical protein